MKNLYIVENIKEEEITNIIRDKHAHVIAFDYKSHKLLLDHHIEHQTTDDFLKDHERVEIFQFCFSLWEWHNKLDEPDLKFHNVNLLNIIDGNELHEALMNIVPKIHVTKKAIEEIQPNLIFASNSIHNLFSNSDDRIKLIVGSNTQLDNYFTHDKINISYEIGGFNLGIKLDRKKYELIKKNLERIVCNIFNLRAKNPNKKKIVLIEFNPEVFFDLLKEIDRQGFQPVLINFRRPAAWSKNSITSLRKSHSLVGLPEDWINKEDFLQIRKIHNAYLKKIREIFLKESLSKIFVFEGVKFDLQMKESFLKALDDRLLGYFFGIYLAEALDKSEDVLGICTLNLSGETEKIFSLIHSRVPLILLQHAFSNYTQTISYLDVLDDFHLLKNKIAVWGDIVKEYLMKERSISEDKIIVSGNPKYDSFVRLGRKTTSKKVVLITPRPIINHVEGIRIELYEKYEKTIDKLLGIVDETDNVEIIFKLHPQQSEHNEIMKQYIKNKNRNIKISQFKPIKELLTECDLHVNIAPDNFDASTVILEAMILGRPTLNIQLQSTKIEFEFMKDGAVKTINFDSNIKEEIFELIFDERRSNELIENSKIHLKRYISNHGKASQALVNAIKNLKIE